MNLLRPVSLLMGGLCLSLSLHAANWTDTWLANASVTTTAPSKFSGETRGYISGGGVNMRWRPTGTDYPITVATPRIAAGCGGINAFAGGISYLDADFMVKKAQNIVQAAPYVAFDMALRSGCQVCSTIMNTAENIANKLNSIQLNECGIAKAGVVQVANGNVGGAFDAMKGEVLQGASLDWGTSKNPTQAKEDMRSQNGQAPAGTPTNDLLAGCSARFRNIFVNETDGQISLLEKTAEQLGPELVDYVPVIRGIVGDVLVQYVDKDGNPTASAGTALYTANRVLPCRDNDTTDLQGIVDGALKQMDINGACTDDASAGQHLGEWVKARMTSIGAKMNAGVAATDYAPADYLFLQNSPINVYQLLVGAKVYGAVDAAVEINYNMVAILYAEKMINDTYAVVDEIINTARVAAESNDYSATGSVGYCRKELFGDTFQKLVELQRLTRDQRRAFSLAAQGERDRLRGRLQNAIAFKRQKLDSMKTLVDAVN